MRRVIIESPYAGDIETNLRYARAAMNYALGQGCAPLGSHLLYTQPGVLNDNIPEERTLGMEAGFSWMAVAEEVWVFIDLGVSSGMASGRARAERYGIPVREVSLVALGLW